MRLKDLKQGMVCELRNGGVITVLEDVSYYDLSYKSRLYLVDRYNNDLTHNVNYKEHKKLDIMKITYGDKVVFERNESRRFVPVVGERYYYSNQYGEVSTHKNIPDVRNKVILRNNEVFKKREEAEKRLRQQQATLSVERWIAENDVEVDLYNTGVPKWFIGYNIDEKELNIDYYTSYTNTPKQFILSSQEKAKQLIKERAKELKIMFGVE